MPLTKKPSIPTQPARRSVRVTGRKYAAVASSELQQAFGPEHRDKVRPRVAAMSSESNRGQLLNLSSVFLESPEDFRGLPVNDAEWAKVVKMVEMLGYARIAQAVRPLSVQRMRAAEHSGYPLKRTLLVTFNREKGQVLAELKEVSQVLGIQGIGIDEESALRDLERQFDQLVCEKVRIPPHARLEKDEPARNVVNYLVDWDQFDRENPLPTLLWGQVVKNDLLGSIVVRWLRGPGGVHDKVERVPFLLLTPYFINLPPRTWFRAVAKIYPQRVEWIEPPHRIPDPNDKAARAKAWDAIPKIVADDPDAWPLKSE